jgi:hypothetical protein
MPSYGVAGTAMLQMIKKRVSLAAGRRAIAKRRFRSSTTIPSNVGVAGTDVAYRQRLALLPSFAPPGFQGHDTSLIASRGFTPKRAEMGGSTQRLDNRPDEQSDVARAKVVNSTAILPRMHEPLDDNGETGRSETGGLSAETLRPGALERALSEVFRRQSRLPPAGVTAFDPRLTPAWPGLKLPG